MLVDLSAVPELRGIVREGAEVRIGAATTWTEIAQADLPSGFRSLQEAAKHVGGVQIQNRATIGGNLCNASPAADGVPPLLLLDAEVDIASLESVRTLPLRTFLVGNRRTELRPGEILSAIRVKAPTGMESRFLKLGARRYLVISISMVAAGLRCLDGRVAEARLAVGACSAVARRLEALEEDLVGMPIDEALLNAVQIRHLEPLSPIDDIRATGSYRMVASLELVRRALAMVAGLPMAWGASDAAA